MNLEEKKMPNRVNVIFFGKTPKLELAIIDANEYNEMRFLYENRNIPKANVLAVGGSKKKLKKNA